MELKEVVRMVEEHREKKLSWIEIEEFEKFIKEDGFEVEVLAEAYKVAVLNEAEKPLAYMLQTLKKWRKRGSKTLEEVTAKEEEFQAEKERRQVLASYGSSPNRIPASQVPPLPPGVKGGF